MLKSYEHFLESWVFRAEAGKIEDSIKHLVVLENKEVLKYKGCSHVKKAQEPKGELNGHNWKKSLLTN